MVSLFELVLYFKKLVELTLYKPFTDPTCRVSLNISKAFLLNSSVITNCKFLDFKSNRYRPRSFVSARVESFNARIVLKASSESNSTLSLLE